MPHRATSLTGAAGEHFVAYGLSLMGFEVGSTRGGSPLIDLLVGNPTSGASLALQVKTSTKAFRPYAREPSKSHWEWNVHLSDQRDGQNDLIYIFVDLKGELSWRETASLPDVFVVPSQAVVQRVADSTSPTMPMFWLYEREKGDYLGRWDYVRRALGAT